MATTLKQRLLTIRGPIRDLGDLVAISRAEGCKALGCRKVTVSPQIVCRGNDFLVTVSPKGKDVQNSVACNAESQSKIWV